MKVPSPGESITEVEIATWLVEDGDYVEKDQAIAEVDSDKATLELPAEVSGVITLKAEEGDAVEVGAVVCLIDTDAEKPEGSTDEAPKEDKKEDTTKEEAPKETKSEAKTYATGSASPAAKKILAEKGMDASSISGTGKDGRVTKEEVLKAEEELISKQKNPYNVHLTPFSNPYKSPAKRRKKSNKKKRKVRHQMYKQSPYLPTHSDKVKYHLDELKKLGINIKIVATADCK